MAAIKGKSGPSAAHQAAHERRTLLAWSGLVLLLITSCLPATAQGAKEVAELQEFRNKPFSTWVTTAETDPAFQEAVKFWGEAAVPKWVELLSPAKSAGERRAALQAIELLLRDDGLQRTRRIAQTQVVPVLVSLLGTEKGYFRSRIVNTIRVIGPGAKDATEALLGILRNPVDPDAGRFGLRSGAALALGAIGEPAGEIAPALARALGDQESRVRQSALSGLKSMSWKALAVTNQIEQISSKYGPEFQKATEATLLEIRRPPPPLEGDVLPKVEVIPFEAGAPKGLGETEGKILVLDFWSSTCPPCQPATTHLNDLAKRRKDWVRKVRFIGISEDETLEMARQHAARRNWTSLELFFDQDGQEHKLFRAGLPELVVVNSHGRIAWRGHPMEIELEAVIERMLGGLQEP